jgi:hypothetical protein
MTIHIIKSKDGLIESGIKAQGPVPLLGEHNEEILTTIDGGHAIV